MEWKDLRRLAAEALGEVGNPPPRNQMRKLATTLSEHYLREPTQENRCRKLGKVMGFPDNDKLLQSLQTYARDLEAESFARQRGDQSYFRAYKLMHAILQIEEAAQPATAES